MSPQRTERTHRDQRASWAGMVLAFAITLATFLHAVVSAWVAVSVAMSLVVLGVGVLAAVEARGPTWAPGASASHRSASAPSQMPPRRSAL